MELAQNVLFKRYVLLLSRQKHANDSWHTLYVTCWLTMMALANRLVFADLSVMVSAHGLPGQVAKCAALSQFRYVPVQNLHNGACALSDKYAMRYRSWQHIIKYPYRWYFKQPEHSMALFEGILHLSASITPYMIVCAWNSIHLSAQKSSDLEIQASKWLVSAMESNN